MSQPLSIKVSGERFKPGDRISGTVEVVEAVHAKELTVGLAYREATADYRATGRSVDAPAPLHVGALDPGQSFSFDLQLPSDALPNQTGTVGRVTWTVHVRAVRVGPDLNVWQPLAVELPPVPAAAESAHP